MSTSALSTLVQEFFTVSLPERGISRLTILSYRDALKLLLRFAAQKLKRRVTDLDVDDFRGDMVREFLADLETGRGNQTATRNNRLAAIRSFFSFVAAKDPSHAETSRQVCSVPFKKMPTRSIPYLESDEMEAILAAPNRSTPSGRRDYALLLFLYNSGARVQEITGVRVADLVLERPARVLLRGKGRKERICPLWESTARVIRELLSETGGTTDAQRPVFRNRRGEQLSRFGVDYILKKFVAQASKRCSPLASKRVSPHTIRHTTAVHLLNAGNEINVVRSWLGHVDLRTTNIYAEINLETKRKALATVTPEAAANGRRLPEWQRKPDLVAWLEAL